MSTSDLSVDQIQTLLCEWYKETCHKTTVNRETFATFLMLGPLTPTSSIGQIETGRNFLTKTQPSLSNFRGGEIV